MNQVAKSQRILGDFGGYVGPLLGHFKAMLGHLGLCWRLSGLKFQSQRKHGSVEIEFWVGLGLMLGHLEAMLGLCCAIYLSNLSIYLSIYRSIDPAISRPIDLSLFL
jgi:hypothetical protein